MNNRMLRIRPVPVVVAVSLALGAAVTAFGVARPLPNAALPPLKTVVDRIDLAASLSVAPEPAATLQIERVRRGDSLASVLSRVGAIDGEFMRFVADDPLARELLSLEPGHTVHAQIDDLGHVRRLRVSLGIEEDDDGRSASRRIVVERTKDGLVAREEHVAPVRGTVVRSAVVSTSLFAATRQAGIPDGVASQVADVLGGDVDFYRDLRKGDRLHVIYETLAQPDSLDPPVAGRVLALEFRTQGKSHSAVWFERGDGDGEYFDFDGRSLKKTFLRFPIEFARVSSRFTDSRLHPVLGATRPHTGVDFAAPIGTRVRATGDGVVEFVGVQRGYGNVIVLRHHGDYSTVYAHLSRFAPEVRAGARVAQGAVIGAVGRTGWATGPHLHYELRIGDAPADPLAADLPVARPLANDARARFAPLADSLRLQLDQLAPVALARFE